MWIRLPKDRQTALKTRLFDNACDLARRVPSYRLHVSLHGHFWEELERVLERGGRGGWMDHEDIQAQRISPSFGKDRCQIFIGD